MRIGQLARRFGIPPSDILGFLRGNNIEAESGTNSRLTEETVSMVIKHFAPERLAELIQMQETAPAPEPVIEDQPKAEDQPVAEEQLPVEEPAPVAEASAPELPVEVIRVSKVELQGLKVVGKIDLPQPKKKTEEEQPAEEQSTPDQEQTEQKQPEQKPVSQRPPRREFQKRNDRREQREWNNPLEQKRQQEQREAERKKQEQAERLKEKRTSHYYNKVKSVPTKAVRKVEEPTVVEELETKEPPKTIIGKFFRWLRT